MKLRIKPFNDNVRELYETHSHFHAGDAGLDLFVVEDQLIPGNSTAPIHLQIACENLDNKAYYLFPRSSISKTPLRLANLSTPFFNAARAFVSYAISLAI